jgi:hypothetical protein
MLAPVATPATTSSQGQGDRSSRPGPGGQRGGPRLHDNDARRKLRPPGRRRIHLSMCRRCRPHPLVGTVFPTWLLCCYCVLMLFFYIDNLLSISRVHTGCQKQQVSLSKVKYSIFRIIWWSSLEKSNHKFSYTDFLFWSDGEDMVLCSH